MHVQFLHELNEKLGEAAASGEITYDQAREIFEEVANWEPVDLIAAAVPAEDVKKLVESGAASGNDLIAAAVEMWSRK